jgi:hypothetical protein
MNVRLCDGRDPQSFRRSGGQVLRGVAPRVDDDGLARAVAGDHVARLREAFIVEPPEKHPSISPGDYKRA